MKVDSAWNGRRDFIAHVNGFKVHMDSDRIMKSGSNDLPESLILARICQCAGLAAVGMLTESRQTPQRFKIEAEADDEADDRLKLKDVRLKYFIDGLCDPARVLQAVIQSQTKELSTRDVVPYGAHITYDILLNGQQISHGCSDIYTPHN